jgi:hypothetical protein
MGNPLGPTTCETLRNFGVIIPVQALPHHQGLLMEIPRGGELSISCHSHSERHEALGDGGMVPA